MKAAYVLGAVLAGAATMPALAAGISKNPLDAQAGTYKLDPNHGKVTWSLSHLGFSTYTGQFIHASATLVLDPTLDKELVGEKFFNAAKWPTATFVSTGVTQTGANTADVAGNLTLMGVTKPLTLHVTFNQCGTNPVSHAYEAGFDATAVITRSQYGLTAYVPFVGDNVALQIEGEFHLKS